jgi:hypothetical protein
MPSGSSPKREREYEELKEEFLEEGRYPGREEEVAARIVNKQRADQSETIEARKADREGRSPDRDLPIKDFDHLAVDEVEGALYRLDKKDIRRIIDYERGHRNRKSLLEVLEGNA